jgi:integrase/recombinase XerD
MLKPEKRHTAACVASRRKKDPSAAEYDDYARCRCSYRAIGMLGGRFVRKSLKSSNYEDALRTIRQWEGEGQPAPTDRAPITIKGAVEAYLSDAKDRNLGEDTLSKLKTIFEKQFLPFCTAKGLPFLTQAADVNVMREFRASWKDAPLARSKKQDRIVGFFYFCERSGWLRGNPVTNRSLGRVRVEQKPTDYFRPEEFEAIIDATYLYRGDRWEQDRTAGTRLRALTLLMRWTGLRIRDAITLERSRLTKTDRGGDCISLYQAKTGEPVYCPIPPNIADALRTVPAGIRPDPRYFFWTGNGHPKTAVADFQRSYRRLFKLAELKKRAHPHMFRDTFAVECLRSGVSLERVATLLGHTSIRITEKHYKPHVKALQWQLEDEVQKAWGTGQGPQMVRRKSESAA